MKRVNERILFIREREMNPNGEINIGMGVLATLVSHNYDVKVIDNSSKYVIYAKEDILKIVNFYRPHVICFSIMTCNAYNSYETIKHLKASGIRNPIVAGGLHVSNVCKEVLNNDVDFAVRGEAELIILPLLDRIIYYRDQRKLREKLDMQGVSFIKNDGRFYDGGISPLPMNIDEYSMVDYNLYKMEDYIRTEQDKYILRLLTMRGCPFNCTFCSDQFIKTKIRVCSMEKVIENIEYLNYEFGLDIISIIDTVFILSKKRVIEFCNAIISAGLNKDNKFVLQTDSIRLIDEEVLQLMRKAGFAYISFGIERLDEESQRKINKKQKYSTIINNISTASSLGMITVVNYLMGFPFDNVTLLKKEKENFYKLFSAGVSIISANILTPIPGTKEYDNQNVLPKWYLNPELFDENKPFYQFVKNMNYDPYVVNIYNFDKELIDEMIKIKTFFKAESIKRRSQFLYWLFRMGVGVSFFSKFFYRNGFKNIEKLLFGYSHTILFRLKLFLSARWVQKHQD